MTARPHARVGWVLVALGGAALLGGLLLRPRPPGPPRSQPPALAYRWVVGDRAVYGLGLSAVQDSVPLPSVDGGAHFTSSLSAELELDLTVREVEGERVVLGLAVRELRSYRMELLGAESAVETPVARALLERKEVLAVLDRAGRVLRAEYAPDASPLLKSLMQTVLGEAQVVLGDGDAWLAVEETPAARLRQRYAIAGSAAGDLVHLGKHVDGVEELRALRGGAISVSHCEGDTRVEFARAGFVRAIRAHKVLRAFVAGQQVLDLVMDFRLERRTSDLGAPLSVTSRARGEGSALGLGEPVDVGRSPEEGLRRRAAGLTREELIQGIHIVSVGASAIDQNTWLWRASALARLDDSLLPALEELFISGGVDIRARALTLDLLAAAGTPGAQASLRKLHEVERARSPRNARALLNRFALVERPAPETVRAVRDRYESSAGPERWAAAMVLGAMARQLHQSGRTFDAEVEARRLADGLARADGSEERQALLRALGNAALPELVSAIAAHAADGEPPVRVAVAEALRRIQTPATALLLLGLAADRDFVVQRAALRVLYHYPMEADHLSRLGALVRARTLREPVQTELINLLGAQQPRQPRAVAAVLVALLERPLARGIGPQVRALMARGDASP